MFEHNNITCRRRAGLTLVELLVVITIMTILAAFLVPQLRMVNKERNIREAARLVASTFASASQRAVDEGIAGVEILRNTNIIDGNGVVNVDVNYAGTALYVLRQQPAYIGDDVNAVANWASVTTVTIPEPFEQTDLNIVQVGDYISFNYSAVKYEITAVAPTGVPGDPMVLTLNIGGSQPPIPGNAATDTFPFVIHRQPQRLESSRVDLPEGYIIDLRFSGELNPAPVAIPQVVSPEIPHNPRPLFYEPGTDSVVYQFGANGGVRDFGFTNSVWSPPPAGVDPLLPSTTQYFLIREYDPDDARDQVLEDPNNLWVTVDLVTGSANVAYVASAPMDLSLVENVTMAIQDGRLEDQIRRSRSIAVQRQSAGQ